MHRGLRYLRNLALALLGLLLVLGAVAAGVLLWPEAPPPVIGQNLPESVPEADAEFARRVAEAFPLPIRADALAASLDEQGFTVAGNHAFFGRGEFPCQREWIIRWEAEAGEVRAISGRYGRTCL
ncbi:hypothetical protein [Oceanicella sp. SM1341]|uniref:hypothetical protein n=1 Tax=Oceanicella sp. SM1341 TaxID=1548889 RepID=UPI000E4699FA|nr:hypothetical protein [Oceanicella sp. SM1341]